MSQISAPTIAIPEMVKEFCATHHVWQDLDLAVRLAEETFGPVDRWEIRLEVDPETDERSVTIDIWPPLEVDEAVRRNHSYARAWASSATPQGRGTIRLITNLS